MNKELLLQVRQVILDDPEHFDMDAYADVCGTTCCIAGHALRLAKPDSFSTLNDNTETSILEWEMCGAKALNISDRQADRLFYWDMWPEPFEAEFRSVLRAAEGNEPDRTELAKIAVRRIDHFIATEGRE